MEHHDEIINQILQGEFGQSATAIERMTIGLANEVYLVTLPDRSLIVRMNADPSKMKGSEKYVPLFKSLGIKVPDIIASDYSKTIVPFAYQIMTKIEGQDMGHVIDKLTNDQLVDIAKEVASIFRKLESLPTNGKFGWDNGDDGNFFSSWLELLEHMIHEVKERNEKTGVVGEHYIKVMEGIVKEYKGYFSNVRSVFYFDDLSTKNVMVHKGKFAGVVDLDSMEYGDSLEGVGRIKASWFGTPYGDFYANAVESELGLNPEQRKMVTVYGVLNHIYWLSEKGIQFNQNTSEEINQDQVEQDRKSIELLLAELRKQEP